MSIRNALKKALLKFLEALLGDGPPDPTDPKQAAEHAEMRARVDKLRADLAVR